MPVLFPQYRIMTRIRHITAMALALLCVLPGSLNAGTPAENLSKQPDDWFRSGESRRIRENVLSWQSDYGDWPKNTDTTREPFTGDRSKLQGTFDNGATTGELRLLARAFKLTGDARYQAAFHKGFDHVLRGQYPNGGWPQYCPLRKGYYTHITFNDNCMIRIMEFLSDTTTTEDFSFLNQDRHAAALKAVERGIDCIVKCQVIIDGVPTVWCAQHDEVTFAAANARSYELASLSGAESAGILKYLITIDKPTLDVIRAVKAGAAWFEATKIEGYSYRKSKDQAAITKDPDARPLWARFYELKTNRPFFCDRDGVVKYDLEEIGSERRGGYTWYGNWGESMANDYKKWPHR